MQSSLLSQRSSIYGRGTNNTTTTLRGRRNAAAAAAAAAPKLRQYHHPTRSSRGRVHKKTVAMFTGIVQGMGKVLDVAASPGFSQVRIELPSGAAAGIQIGASVAVNGTCLTVTAADGDVLSFDIMAETLRATSLGGLAAGSAVNYERSARVGDEIGGHTVSGHVHTTARIKEVEDAPNNRKVVFELADAQWAKYVLPKGFIAVDGCSLTVCDVDAASFSVWLIPETLRVTVLGAKGVGDTVNIEIEATTQAIVDTVERVVERYMASKGL
jgi:riboflavin synthase